MNDACMKFDEQNFEKFTVIFTEKVLKRKRLEEKIDESLTIHYIRQNFPLSNFCAIWYCLALTDVIFA